MSRVDECGRKMGDSECRVEQTQTDDELTHLTVTL